MRWKKNRIIGIIVAVFYITGMILAVQAVMTARTAQGAIAWSVSLVTISFVSVPAYLVFGRSKFEGFAFEVTAHIVDESFATEMEKMGEADFAHAVELDPTELQHRSFW